MAKSIVSRQRNKVPKPSKPHPDFPLFPHTTRRWAKKVRGKLHYFGPWDDPQGALEKWLAQKDDLLAGRKPRTVSEGGLTVRDLCNRFLTAKKHMRDAGELSDRTFQDYHSSCAGVVERLGANRIVADLRADDFQDMRAKLAKTRGPVALGNEIQRIRSVFKYGYDAELIDRPVRFGPSFKKPSKRILRQVRNSRGKRMLEADQLRTVVDAAGQPLRAMILLGLNCGYGPTDVSSLPQSALDLVGGWAEFPRPKTHIARRCPLWPETVAAVRDAVASRPAAADEADAGLVFLTRTGKRWVRFNRNGTPDNAVSKEFAKLLTRLGLKSPGINFYSLRRVTETIGGETKDQVAVDAIMGHADDSMAAHYREGISDERLKAVTEMVHSWLFRERQLRTRTEKTPAG